MYISRRSAVVRNACVSIANGSVTLVILLIAPLGLAAVIINTLLVMTATYIVCSVADRIIFWLQPQQNAELTSSGVPKSGALGKYSLHRWWR